MVSRVNMSYIQYWCDTLPLLDMFSCGMDFICQLSVSCIKLFKFGEKNYTTVKKHVKSSNLQLFILIHVKDHNQQKYPL